ncbi:Gfo/Idh/MocA family oxidoreductase [Cohnella lubricantis]|uniref:Gfo/Idh/MocA family oxidoreductase n=1 Tax=Cohnella lubricantis TaxID=2163172 RepID=A0A841TE67_9BACL|nr:Gfo/Idh/MocA family oxidoreductase [Cohnella lubricantis]MBB6676741.1 Gfo/Idh/MocA family oxidoreductase [Cohnella lubricantis]MBP2117787.1 putative dehydrogenase [Cohnella lubricantis]
MEMDMDQIKVGIIGLGSVGSKVKQALDAHPAMEVAALCEQNLDLLHSHLGSSEGVAAYSDYRSLLEREQVDLIYLAVPPKHHHAIALDILRAGKHLLCEKPLANSVEEAEEMLAAADRAGVVHAMNFPTYYRPSGRALLNLVREGKLGAIRKIAIKAHFPQWPRSWQRNSWISSREQGGFVREVLPHFLQLAHRCFGKAGEIITRVEYPADSEACETGITAWMALTDGGNDPIPVLIDGLSQAGVKEEASLTIYGSEGTAQLIDWSGLRIGRAEEDFTELALEQHDHLLELVDHVARAIRGDHHDLITFREGLEVQRTLEMLRGN